MFHREPQSELLGKGVKRSISWNGDLRMISWWQCRTPRKAEVTNWRSPQRESTRAANKKAIEAMMLRPMRRCCCYMHMLLHALAARHAATGLIACCVGFYSWFRPNIVSCFCCCSFNLEGVVCFLFVCFLNICLQLVVFHESQATPWTFLKQNWILVDSRDSSS